MRQIWIIRFSDGTVGSCYGTREGAIELGTNERETRPTIKTAPRWCPEKGKKK